MKEYSFVGTWSDGGSGISSEETISVDELARKKMRDGWEPIGPPRIDINLYGVMTAYIYTFQRDYKGEAE